MLLKSLTFEGSIILGRAISGQATQTQYLMTIHLIDRDTLPLFYTWVLLHILHTLDSSLQAYFYLKRRRLVKDTMNCITLTLLDPPSGAVSLVLNVFLSCYNSGTFLSHLAAGEYGFNIVGAPCIDIYQMYVVVPMIQGGIPYIGVGLVYRSPSLYVGTNEDCTIFLKAFFTHCESSIDVAPSQAFFLRKRRELRPLFCPMPSWICVDTVTLCPGVIDPEGAQARTIHSSQTLTFHMMLATKHHFHSIQERANVFIPFEFRDPRDIRPRWRTASFQYLNGVWEWVQVTSDNVVSHYTLLANAHGAKPAQS